MIEMKKDKIYSIDRRTSRVLDAFKKSWNEIYDKYDEYIIFESDQEMNEFKETILKEILNLKFIGRKIETCTYTYIIARLNSACKTRVPIPQIDKFFSFKLYSEYITQKIKPQTSICDLESTAGHYLRTFLYEFEQNYHYYLNFYVRNYQVNELLSKMREIKTNLFVLKDFLIKDCKITAFSPSTFISAIIYIYFRFYEETPITQTSLEFYFKVAQISIRNSVRLIVKKVLESEGRIRSLNNRSSRARFLKEFLKKLSESDISLNE